MKKFSDMGIKVDVKHFTGDKIKIERIINREIKVFDYKITDSQFKDKCLYLQIELNGNMHVVFTGSKMLINAIEQVDKSDFPFSTTIQKPNEYFQFT